MKCEECKKELTGKYYYNMESQIELCEECYCAFFAAPEKLGTSCADDQELDAYNNTKPLFFLTAGILIGATFSQLFYVPLISGIISILICFGGLAYLKWTLEKIK